jgi:hypothetical protein
MGTIRKLDQRKDKYNNRTQEEDKGNRKARRAAIAKNRKTITVNKHIKLDFRKDANDGVQD